MKVIIVNNVKNNMRPQDLQTLTDRICDYFLTKKIRNKKQLIQKKELTLVFLSPAEMQRINKQFRNKNRSTDILSFQGPDSQSLGELLLCVDILAKQAKRQGHPLRSEVSYMLIHGILHLLGYDHEISLKEEKLMFRLQDACFEKLSGLKILFELQK